MNTKKFSSNIIAGSNVLFCKSEDPRYDKDFVSELTDYERLKDIKDLNNHLVPRFPDKQRDIVKYGNRCIGARNDPCWGYSDRYGMTCACTNTFCHRIWQCNRHYECTAEEANYWKPSPVETALYGDPQRLRRYFKVDMISDDEMRRYNSDPTGEGRTYSAVQKRVMHPGKAPEKQKKRINPVTGKIEVPIGYQWKITDNADYQNDELVPIWGSVDEDNKKPFARKKTSRMKRLDHIVGENTERIAGNGENIPVELDHKMKTAVRSRLIGETGLRNLPEDIASDSGSGTLILLDNPAERGYVSKVLLSNGIEHGFKTGDKVCLAVFDEYADIIPLSTGMERIYISNTVFDDTGRLDALPSWITLSKEEKIFFQLNMPRWQYRDFRYGVGAVLQRWCCENMYGITHICIEPSDLIIPSNLQDGIYPAMLIEDAGVLRLVTDDGENPIGKAKDSFMQLILRMEEAQMLAGRIAYIESFALIVHGRSFSVLGIGHVKYDEY